MALCDDFGNFAGKGDDTKDSRDLTHARHRKRPLEQQTVSVYGCLMLNIQSEDS